MAKVTEPTVAPVAPQQAAASYDFNALHDAIKRGEDADKAAEQALILPVVVDAPLPEPAAVEEVAAPTEPAPVIDAGE